jgi:hypothetical protein
MKAVHLVRILLSASLLVAASLAAAADSTTRSNDSPPPALIQHADMLKWISDGERGLWIQLINLRWFYARFTHVCHGLSSTNSVVFDTRSAGHISQTSAIALPGGARCPFQSLAASVGPPQTRFAVAPVAQTQ